MEQEYLGECEYCGKPATDLYGREGRPVCDCDECCEAMERDHWRENEMKD